MRQTEVVIVGGGLAGSTAAAMLGRAGVDTIVVDPHETYPTDFRCEKLDEQQIRLFEQTGLADEVLPHTTPVEGLWVARRGRVIEKRPNHQFGFRYEDFVNRIRAAIPANVISVVGKVASLATGPEWQSVSLSTGEEISALLIILANGLSISLRHLVGLERQVVSANHSVSVGFDLEAADRAFPFPALTYYPERVGDRFAYLTLFPVAGAMRANFFVYRDLNDPWLRRVRHEPKEALLELLPGLRRVTGDFEVTSTVRIRPVDLVVTSGHVQAGVALVGDAFSTSCPGAGTGAHKAFTDVGRLCGVHIPRWLKTPGMGADKIAAFYDDPIKQASEAYSTRKAYYLRSLSTETSLAWRARRTIKFLGQVAVGTLRRVGPGPLQPLRQTAPQGANPRALSATAYVSDDLTVIPRGTALEETERVPASNG